MRKNSFLFVALLMAAVIRVHGQFQHAVGTEVYDAGRSVQPTFVDKGYVIAGHTKFEVFGNYEATLVKTKPDGSLVWSAVYGYKDFETFNSVREVPYTSTPNLRRGYAALGVTRDSGFGGDDMYFVRTDLTGVPMITRVYGRSKDDRGHCLQFIKDPSIGYGFVMAGESNSYPYYSGMDVYVVKTDEFGNIVRAVVIGGPGDESAYWIEQTRDFGFIVAGYTTSRACGAPYVNQDIFVIRLNANLGIVWNAIVGGGSASPHRDIAYGVVENPLDSSFTITGVTQSFGVSQQGDAFLLNLKSNGAFNWMKTYGMELTEQGNSIHIDRNPVTGAVEYVVGGFSNSYNPDGRTDAYVFKTDVNGSLLWTAIYGTKGREHVTEITGNIDKGYVFTGEVEDDWSIGDDIYHVTTDRNGKSGTGCEMYVDQREKRHRVCYTSSAQQVYVDEARTIDRSFKYVDYKIRRCDPSGIGLLEEETNSELVRLQPDTENGRLTVQLNSSLYEGASIKVFNMRGEQVAKEKMLKESIEMHLDDLPSGLYIMHVTSKDGEHVIRKKFVK